MHCSFIHGNECFLPYYCNASFMCCTCRYRMCYDYVAQEFLFFAALHETLEKLKKLVITETRSRLKVKTREYQDRCMWSLPAIFSLDYQTFPKHMHVQCEME